MNATTHCETHPDVESELRCNKCDKVICPRCMVQTPVGARCRECANLRRPVLYTVPPLLFARAGGAALLLAVVVGAAAGYLVPGLLHNLGFIGLFAGAGYGWLTAKTVETASNRRRSVWLQAAAAASGIAVYLVYNAVGGAGTILPRNDIGGYLFAGIAALVGWSYLR